MALAIRDGVQHCANAGGVNSSFLNRTLPYRYYIAAIGLATLAAIRVTLASFD